MNLLLEAMVKKLSYTATLELVPLMEVPGVKQVNRDLFLSLPNKGPFRELFFFFLRGGQGGWVRGLVKPYRNASASLGSTNRDRDGSSLSNSGEICNQVS